MRNIPITVLTFLVVISFFVIVVLAPYHIDNDNYLKYSTPILQGIRDVSRKPKNFDTQETFLLKMYNPEIRDNFLDDLNRL
jgi:hypothetical protein